MIDFILFAFFSLAPYFVLSRPYDNEEEFTKLSINGQSDFAKYYEALRRTWDKSRLWKPMTKHLLDGLPKSGEQFDQQWDLTVSMVGDKTNVVEHLYSSLGHLDSKASGLLSFHALCVAVAAITIQGNSNSPEWIWLAPFIGMSLLSSGYAGLFLLRVLSVRWTTLFADDRNAYDHAQDQRLFLTRAKRTYWLRKAWALSFVSGMSLLLCGSVAIGLTLAPKIYRTSTYMIGFETFDWATLVGFCGMGLILFAYGYLTTKSRPKPLIIHLANLAGALLLIISLTVHVNIPSLVLQLFWAGIALFGLVKLVLSRKVAP